VAFTEELTAFDDFRYPKDHAGTTPWDLLGVKVGSAA